MENITHVDEYVDNFEKVIIYKTCNTIKNIYKTLDNYLAVLKLLTKPYHSLTESEIHAINKFNELFQLDKYTVEKIITKPRINGKQVCITKQVLNKVKERGIIKTFNHGTIRYKSGKNFKLFTKYTIDISLIQSYFNNENVYNTNSNFYTKQQHKLIDKFILNYKKENKPKQTIVAIPKNDIQITNTINTQIKEEKMNNNQNEDCINELSNELAIIQNEINENHISKEYAKKLLEAAFISKEEINKLKPSNKIAKHDLSYWSNQYYKLITTTRFIKNYPMKDKDKFKKICIDLIKLIAPELNKKQTEINNTNDITKIKTINDCINKFNNCKAYIKKAI